MKKMTTTTRKGDLQSYHPITTTMTMKRMMTMTNPVRMYTRSHTNSIVSHHRYSLRLLGLWQRRLLIWIWPVVGKLFDCWEGYSVHVRLTLLVNSACAFESGYEGAMVS